MAQSCDCAGVDVCDLFVDPTLLPPGDDVELDIRRAPLRPPTTEAPIR